MAPVRQLKAEVERKAVMRLEFEKKDKDPEIVEEGGVFYGDPTGFALNKSVQYIIILLYINILYYYIYTGMMSHAASDDASDHEEKEDGDDEGEGSDDVCEAKECGELCGYSDYGYGDDDGQG